MKTRIVLFLAVVSTITLAQPMFADTVYTYTGNPFQLALGVYTTSDKVTVSVELSDPLGPNMALTMVTPLAFSFSDGVRTLTNLNASGSGFTFATSSTGAITQWDAFAFINNPTESDVIRTGNPALPSSEVTDFASLPPSDDNDAHNLNAPGVWSVAAAPDAGSTVGLFLLSLTAFGVAARQFKRAAA
jgi:hypothetical protein